MADDIYELSTTAGSNSSVGGMNWAEGQAPSTVNNSSRQFACLIARFIGDLGGAISAGGTADGLTVAANNAFSTLANGRIIAFRATADNTAAATLNVNGIGAKAIRKMDSSGDVAIIAGEIQNTGLYMCRYSTALNGGAGAWLLMDPTPAATLGKPPTQQIFLTPGAFTWTKPAGCRFAMFEAVGGGAGGGGVDGAAGLRAGGGGGGGAGAHGMTGLIDVTAIASGAGSIGAGGAGVSAANGANGGDTTITIGATIYTWGGGVGGAVAVISTSGNSFYFPGAGGVCTNLVGAGDWAQPGAGNATDNVARSGNGASSAFGKGAPPIFQSGSGASAGTAASAGQYGAGGSGAVGVNTAADFAGGAGIGGYMRVWEFY